MSRYECYITLIEQQARGQGAYKCDIARVGVT